MNIVTVGLNHKSAPVEVRERLSFPSENLGPALTALTHKYGLNEGVILSTCNRVEVTAVTDDVDKGVRQIKRFLSDTCSIPLEELDEHLYTHTLEGAVKHLFRVAASLDSLVMGEPQILGQVKDGFGYAVEHNTAGVVINKLYHKAFQVAKRIRTETKIGSSAVSISFTAVELARKIFGDLSGKSCMLIGAGEMGELAAKHLSNCGVRSILLANRTFEKAVEMAKGFDGTAIMFREFPHYLKSVDIVIASTGSPTFIIKPEHVTDVMPDRKNRPMFFIDISVPRNIDPLVNEIDNAYVYDVDDLQQVVAANMKERAKEAEEAESIIVSEIGSFYQWVKSLDVVPTIIELRRSFEEIRRAEVERCLSALGDVSKKEKKAIEQMSSSIVNKILHNPVTHLKKEANSVEGDFYINATRRLFDLEDILSGDDELKEVGKDE